MIVKKQIKTFKIIGCLFLLIFAFLYAKMDVSMSALESARFALVEAVAQDSVFHIEQTQFRTVDKVIKNNHIYSDKPPALSWTIGMIMKVPMKIFNLNFYSNYHLLIWLVNFIFLGAVNVLIFLWLFNYLIHSSFAGSVKLKFLLSLSSVLCTWILSYSVMLNNHTPAALAVAGLMVALYKYHKCNSYKSALAAGFTSGALGALDLPGAFCFAIATTVAVFLDTKEKSDRIKNTCYVIGAGLLMLLFYLGLNYYAYGTIMPLYVAGKTGTFSPTVYMDGVLAYFWNTLFWTRGLFSYQPFLLAAIPGFILYWKKEKSGWGALCLFIASVATCILYNTITCEFGGYAYGFRYLILIIPVFWYWAAIFFIKMKSKVLKYSLLTILLGWGAVTSFIGSYAPYCVSFEGFRSPVGHFTRTLRSSFWGNLLVLSYENDATSKLTTALIKHYGNYVAYKHLHASAIILKKIDLLPKLNEDVKKGIFGK